MNSNINNLEEEKSRYMSIVSNIPGAVYRCYCNKNWDMQYISDYIKIITGYKSIDFIDSKVRTYSSIIHPADTGYVASAVNNAVRDKKAFEIEYRIVTKAGVICWVFEKGCGIYSSNNKVKWLDGVIFDISERKQMQLEKDKLLTELKNALANIKQLSSLIPICASCKKVRDDKGYWKQIEVYIEKHSESSFTHGICPECAVRLYGDKEWYKKMTEDPI